MPGVSLDGLDPRFRAQVEALLAAAGPSVWVASGFRSRAQQEAVYARYKAGNGPVAAVPGTSKHEVGLAVDFGGPGYKAIVPGLAPKYGLVRTVPSEDWHYEPDWSAGTRAITASDGAPATLTAATPAPASSSKESGGNTSILGVLRWATNPDNWRRAGMVALGAAVLVVGGRIVLKDVLPLPGG